MSDCLDLLDMGWCSIYNRSCDGSRLCRLSMADRRELDIIINGWIQCGQWWIFTGQRKGEFNANR